MARKIPDRDSLLLPRDTEVEFKLKIPRGEAYGGEVIIDGERTFGQTYTPNVDYHSYSFSKSEPREYDVLLVITEAGSLYSTNSSDSSEDVVIDKATWNVTVVDPEHLYNTDREKFIQLVKDMTVIYTMYEIMKTGRGKLKEYIDRLSEDEKEQITTLEDFNDE